MAQIRPPKYIFWLLFPSAEVIFITISDPEIVFSAWWEEQLCRPVFLDVVA